MPLTDRSCQKTILVFPAQRSSKTDSNWKQKESVNLVLRISDRHWQHSWFYVITSKNEFNFKFMSMSSYWAQKNGIDAIIFSGWAILESIRWFKASKCYHCWLSVKGTALKALNIQVLPPTCVKQNTKYKYPWLPAYWLLFPVVPKKKEDFDHQTEM